MSRKRDEIIEKSKYIFGENAFDYSKIPDDVIMGSKITIICKKCNSERNLLVSQHIFGLYGCKICKNNYIGFDPNDTEEQAKQKIDKINKRISEIKEKYRKKTYEDLVIKKHDNDEITEDLKLLFENNQDIIKDSIYDVTKLCRFLNSNGFKLIKV